MIRLLIPLILALPMSLFFTTPLPASTLPGITFDKIASTKGYLTSMALDSTGRIFYSVTTGQVYRLDGGQSTEVALVPTASSGNAVLTGIAFRSDDELVAHYVSPDLTADVLTSVRLSEGSQTEIFRWVCDGGRPCPTEHHGGNPVVAPDGSIYLGIGDFGGGEIAQNPLSPAGKVFRVNGGASHMFALGLRNPFDFAFDAQNNTLILGDNGPEGEDEINIVRDGDNLGWPFTVGAQPPVEGAVAPIYTFANTIAPTGVLLLRERMFMNRRGLLVGAYVTRALYYFPDIDARPLPDPLVIVSEETEPIIDVVQDSRGEIFFASGEAIYQLRTPRPGDANGDGRIESNDLEAIAREIHDGDGNRTVRASGGSFAGSWGADVNVDGTIDSRDLVALVRILNKRTRPAK